MFETRGERLLGRIPAPADDIGIAGGYSPPIISNIITNPAPRCNPFCIISEKSGRRGISTKIVVYFLWDLCYNKFQRAPGGQARAKNRMPFRIPIFRATDFCGRISGGDGDSGPAHARGFPVRTIWSRHLRLPSAAPAAAQLRRNVKFIFAKNTKGVRNLLWQKN